MKKLLLDIETAPNLAYVWGLWDENIPLDRLINSGYILSWAAKWHNEDDDRMFFATREHMNKKEMLSHLWLLLDEADAVIHYNGKRFDVPWINREFLSCGAMPPSPYKQIDLLETVKKKFKFPSNKLQYVAEFLGVGTKVKNDGFDLWVGCMNNDPTAWKNMKEYNIGDVELLEKVYLKLLPWIQGHANHSLFSDGSTPTCPTCGGTHLHKRGFAHTLASVYQRYRCADCGSWSKDNKILNKKQYKTTSIAT